MPFATTAQSYSTSDPGNGSDYETMMEENFGKDPAPHRVKYRMLKK
jgi:hypothetical protein